MAIGARRTRNEVVVAVSTSVGAVALVTALVAILDTWMPVLSLGALYVFAVLPVAIVWGLVYAIPVAVGSMLLFNWLFLPPRHSFTLADGENWLVLVLYLVVAVVTSELASRARQRAAAAEAREQETAAVADIATMLLRQPVTPDAMTRVSARVADALDVPLVTIRLADDARPGPGAFALTVEPDGTTIGVLEADGGRPDAAAADRLLPAVASVIAVAADRDASQEEALEAETLRRSDAMKTAVLQAVSHDLRTPLTAVSAAVSSLASPNLELDELDRSELLETIRVESQRLEKLVGDLLDLSRLQAGAVHPRRALQPVEELVTLALDELDPKAPVLVEVAPDLPAVEVDAVQITRVLVNVIENALRHTPSGGRVTVTATQDDAGVVLRVQDDGPGIRRGEEERVFEPFHRGESGDAHRGSGLGLAIARGFAEENGAHLVVEQSDRGALLALTLPVTARLPGAGR